MSVDGALGLFPPAEEEFLPLSGLQHLLFCRRQCALIHVEGIWAENRLTAEGRLLHERVESGEPEDRPGVRIRRDLVLQSSRLGLIGKADVVEFHAEDRSGEATVWRPFPIEYKRGARRAWLHDEVQLCAQAIALEDMLGLEVPRGAIYHGTSRRRRDVAFGEELREHTLGAAREFHQLIRAGCTPAATLEAKCESCSLLAVCLPKETSSEDRACRYLRRVFREHISENSTEGDREDTWDIEDVPNETGSAGN
ncbi:MAG: CRISPR-associated protein Cas4 [Candidatus Wallbacteria bacterium]|nr:CRISPR-associated protein Cas4 [Candidatus Wallbacteria bacterium]